MNALRRQRLTVIAFLFVGGTATVTLAMVALRANINHFYLPDQVANNEVPIERQVRAGGMVAAGSIQYDDEGLGVSFLITNLQGSTFPVRFEGLLPSLFRENQGTIVVGKLTENGVFVAHEVLAKHDENYVPPELKDMHNVNDS